MASDPNNFNERVIAEFRANEGKVGPPFEGTPLMILTTTGAKSGMPREIPLAYTRDGERFVVIASKAGAPDHPDWYYNLKANPQVRVEVGTEAFPAMAGEAEGAERDRLFAHMAAQMANFAEYQRNTERTIPVFVIEPRTDGA